MNFNDSYCDFFNEEEKISPKKLFNFSVILENTVPLRKNLSNNLFLIYCSVVKKQCLTAEVLSVNQATQVLAHEGYLQSATRTSHVLKCIISLGLRGR